MALPAYAMNRASFPEMYERELVGPLFRPFVDPLLEEIRLTAGDRLLDIACGTGVVARVAKERLGPAGHVVGVDLSPQMLDVGKRIAPDIEWREGDAMALPLAQGETFDVVTCQQGLQFVADRAAAVREMHRALSPRGRLAIATWRPLEEVPLFRDLNEIAVRHLGPFVDGRHAFGNAADLERLLTGAGFRDVRVRTVSRTVRFTEPGVIVQMNAMAVVGMGTAGRSIAEDERARLVTAIANEGAAVVPRYADGQGIAVELPTNLATARV